MASQNHYAENLEESLLGINPGRQKKTPDRRNDQGRVKYGLREPLTNGLRR